MSTVGHDEAGTRPAGADGGNGEMEPSAPPSTRGVLIVSDRVVERLAQGALGSLPSLVAGSDSTTRSRSQAGVELDVTVELFYPDEPLSTVLAGIRRHLVDEVSSCLGRPVRRLDLRIEKMVAPPAPPRVV